MDKTEMYNKIINAIDVLSRVVGEELVFKREYSDDKRMWIQTYTIGGIKIRKWDTSHSPGVIVGDSNVTDHLEDKHLKTILGKIEGIYFARRKKLEEENMSYAMEYLNSFVGK